MKTAIICKARDGSTTMRNLLARYEQMNSPNCNAFQTEAEYERDMVANWDNMRIGYVTSTFDLWPAIIEFIEKRETSNLFKCFETMTKDIEITHGLAFVLPALAAYFGPDLKLVVMHRNVIDHTTSLENRLKINPEHWLGYSSLKQQKMGYTVVRPTAVSFGEASIDEWDSFTPYQKFRWFVEKQETLLDEHLHLFKDVTHAHTETLSDEKEIARILNFIHGDRGVMPKPVHLHKGLARNAETITPDAARKLEELVEQIDFQKLVRDDEYALTVFRKDLLDRFPEQTSNIDHLFDCLFAYHNKQTK